MLPLWEKFFKGNDKVLSVYVHTPPPGYDMNVSSVQGFIFTVTESFSVLRPADPEPEYKNRVLDKKFAWGSSLVNRCREASSSQRVTRLLKRAFFSSLRKLCPCPQLHNRLHLPTQLRLQFCRLFRTTSQHVTIKTW
ncbi:hypothetical protein HID58_083700 [Brassica napus]|uniref:Uncharacterized protein n=1 Tax=Brassica napus TaxID=3708 RepID=A0ABQ7YFJ4_BRANA|nr:hypothetical protein HID58_083700 [Brassica napus]